MIPNLSICLSIYLSVSLSQSVQVRTPVTLLRSFHTNTFEKDMNSLLPQLWVELYHYCPSTMMASVLDNP